MVQRTSSLAQLRAMRKQLLNCLPAGMAGHISSGVTPYVLVVDEEHARLYREDRLLGETQRDGGLDPSIASLLKSHEHPLLVQLPQTWVLRRTVALPAAAQENLRQVISFELDRFSPFTAEQVYFDYRQHDREGASDMLAVDVALVPRKRVDEWLGSLRSAGIAVDTLSAPELWEEANLLPPELRPRINFRRLAQKMLPLTLVVVLLGAAMALPLWQKRSIAISLQAREAALRGKAGEVIELREKVDAAIKSLEAIRDDWRAFPPALDVLQVLTKLLPDSTSLQRMEIKGDTLTINGTSTSASSLIALLQNSPAFESPHFLSPVTQQRGKEVFNLSAQIKMPFPRDLGETVTTEASSAAEKARQGAAPAAQPKQASAPAPDNSKASAGKEKPASGTGTTVQPAPLPPAVSYSRETSGSSSLPSAPTAPPQRTISGAG